MDMIEARATHRCRAAPERVFDAWLDPRAARRWLRRALQDAGLPGDIRTVEIEPHVGGAFRFTDARPAGVAEHWGTYRAIERPHTLAFTWFTSEEDEAADASLVTVQIEPAAGGCVASVVHRMDRAWGEYVPETERGWARMLAAIDAITAEDRDPPPAD